jgi:hypothetical protein
MSATSADMPVASADRALAPAFAACRFALVSMIELADPLDFVLRAETRNGALMYACASRTSTEEFIPVGHM